jgi:hypothetical protein
MEHHRGVDEVEKTSLNGSGRVLFWAHAAGPTERRGSVRSGLTAFELMPLATPRNPYENVLMVDLATHPRLTAAEDLQRMLPPGIHLSDVARQAMPAVPAEALTRLEAHTGETFWTVSDTTTAFAAYWVDGDPYDLSPDALDVQHRRIRALGERHRNLPINVFPISYQTATALLHCGLRTLGDVMELDALGVRTAAGLNFVHMAQAYRTIEGTLAARSG